MNPYFEKAKLMQLPPLPWSIENLGEEKYCKLALELGYFNPKSEPVSYRPSLDPTPFMSLLGNAPTSKLKATKEK